LWLVATTAISIELYNPGAILPGVVGVISLILALAVNQIIPMSQGAMMLLIAGAALIIIDLFVASIVLGVGGLISIVLGALYLVDSNQAPGLSVSAAFVLPIAAVLGGFMLIVAIAGARALRRRPATGIEGMIGMEGRALENFAENGAVLVAGEQWKAFSASGLVSKGDVVVVEKVLDGLKLKVRKKG
jgi:membrane-bound serine protease (ClpP class)